MTPPPPPLQQTRRQFFGKAALGVGTAALAALIGRELLTKNGDIPPPQPKLKAKRVIHLVMSGGPSQHDLWDYKPKLRDLYGQRLPKEIRDGQRITTMTSTQPSLALCPSKYEFSRKDNNDGGVWVSELLPHTAKVAKDLCVINSTFTNAINHDPAITFIQTGSEMPGRPSLGAWLSYGLGSLNENLPEYVVMHAKTSYAEQSLFHRLWGSGFMPSEHQGVLLRSHGDPLLYLSNPDSVSRQDRRAQLDALAALNQAEYEHFGDPEILSRIEQHEMAYRLQTSVPEVMDLSSESAETFELYGEEAREPGTFAACCLNARRLAERGVRTIQIFHRGWDAHDDLPEEHESQCRDVDRGCAALIRDLKRRGMLDETLVIWGGEFGRTAYCQGKLTKENYGRDHHPRCFTTWMAGGGVKPGITYGQTDDYGYNIVDADGNMIRPTIHDWTPGTMHVHDLNATILHLMGFDHKELTYRYQGRDFRLTDVHGHVVRDILA
ncbi:MAG: DUF1501 domain-containing protein [Limisphaerales bacterium]